MIPKMRTVQGFKVVLNDSRGETSEFLFENSGWAEQMTRALVHSGFTVTLSETEWERPLTVAERKEYEYHEKMNMGAAEEKRGRAVLHENAAIRAVDRATYPTAPEC